MSAKRIAVGGFQHETNTFAPMPTTWEDFNTPGAWPALTQGDQLFPTVKGINIPVAGFVEAAQTNAPDWTLVPLLWTAAEPAGYVTADAFDRICALLIDGIKAAQDLDAIYLDLHGAMVVETHDDGEAELLRRIREVVGPDLPIAVSLDLHGNMSRAFFERASCVTIYRTYPHLDMAETGARAQLLLSALLDRAQPFASAWRQIDYIIPLTAQSTMHEPGRRLYGMLPGLVAEGVMSADFVIGFPPADIPDTGCSIFVYGTDQGAADRAADTLATAISESEAEFHNPLIPVDQAVERALQLSETAMRPVVIADPQDNPGAGGVGDTTGLLQALINAGAQRTALSMLWDPAAAARAHEAGEGAAMKIALGGRYPETGGPPVEATVHVERISDGVFPFTGPMYGGSTADVGPSAVLHLKENNSDIRVVVGSTRCQNADQAMFRAFGIEPMDQAILGVKSAVHFLGDYDPIAAEIIFADAPGTNPCRVEVLPFTRLRSGVRLGPMGRVHQNPPG